MLGHSEDRYGIPDNMFGRVQEDFYGIVGRVAMLGAMVDFKVLSLLWTLDRKPQQAHAGKYGSRLIEDCQRKLRELPDAEEVTGGGLNLLDRVRESMYRRNAVVHSLWSSPSLENAFGWRPLPESHRDSERDWIVSHEMTEADLTGLISDLVGMVDDLNSLTGKVGSIVEQRWQL